MTIENDRRWEEVGALENCMLTGRSPARTRFQLDTHFTGHDEFRWY